MWQSVFHFFGAWKFLPIGWDSLYEILKWTSIVYKRDLRAVIKTGPSCSKLTKSLVNIPLNFQQLISQICQHFWWKKLRSFSNSFNKNISAFGYKVIKHLTSWPLNELVKLTMLWTTGPSSSVDYIHHFIVKTKMSKVKKKNIVQHLDQIQPKFASYKGADYPDRKSPVLGSLLDSQ